VTHPIEELALLQLPSPKILPTINTPSVCSCFPSSSLLHLHSPSSQSHSKVDLEGEFVRSRCEALQKMIQFLISTYPDVLSLPITRSFLQVPTSCCLHSLSDSSDFIEEYALRGCSQVDDELLPHPLFQLDVLMIHVCSSSIRPTARRHETHKISVRKYNLILQCLGFTRRQIAPNTKKNESQRGMDEKEHNA
jgi:hypothetical protein